MKKLVLLPLMVLPLLTGCSNTKPNYSLEEWLTNIEEGTMTFIDMDVYDEETGRNRPTNGWSDYQYTLAKFIVDNTANKSLSNFTPTRDDDHIRYILRREMGDYFEIQINVYENNLTMFEEGYSKDKEYLTKITSYSLPKGVGKKIIDEAINKWEEMDTLADESANKVYQEMSPENFYTYIENAETKPFVKFNNKKSRDNDLKLLDAMKDLVCIEVDDLLTLGEGNDNDSIVYYGIEKEYVVAIGRDYFDKKPLLQLTRYYVNPAITYGNDNLSECRVTYSISNEKLNAFMDAYRAL